MLDNYPGSYLGISVTDLAAQKRFKLGRLRLSPLAIGALALGVAAVAGGGFLLASKLARLKQDYIAPVSRVVDLGHGVSMLSGEGGNLAVAIGADAMLMVDDQFVENSKANLEVVRQLAGHRRQFVINTHWHGDHTGGNAKFKKAGATVFAAENARRRLSGALASCGRGTTLFAPPTRDTLPIVTFDGSMDFYLNGETIHAFVMPNAHTDGDVFVYFKDADVLHMGDVFVRNEFPFIDTCSGGSLAGYISAQKRALAMATANTRIIPGHGELATRADLQQTLDVIEGATAAVKQHVERGDTLDQTVAAKPLRRWDAQYGKGMISADEFTATIYGQLTGRTAQPYLAGKD